MRRNHGHRKLSFRLARVQVDEAQNAVSYECSLSTGEAAIVRVAPKSASGVLIVVASDGLPTSADPNVKLPIDVNVDEGLPSPYPMLKHVQQMLSTILSANAITVHANNSALTTTTCRHADGRIPPRPLDPTLKPQPFALLSSIGKIASISEVSISSGKSKFLPDICPKALKMHPSDRAAWILLREQTRDYSR